MRFAGLGFELAVSIAGGALLGWWIDRRAGTAPRWLGILVGVGAVGGLYNLVRSALAASREAARGGGPGGSARPRDRPSAGCTGS